MVTKTQTAPTTCPRCGYDQSGAIAAWERNEPACCPLAGVCPECGLEFAWRDVLNPVYSRELRMFEHAQGHRARAFERTWWKAVRPTLFWRWLRLEHEVRPSRLAVMAIAGFLLTHLAVSGIVITLDLLMYQRISSVVLRTPPTLALWWDRMVIPLSWRLGPIHGLLGQGPHINPRMATVTASVLIMPTSFLLLPLTLRRARVRVKHLLRVFAYGLIWMPLVVWACPLCVLILHATNEIMFRAGTGMHVPQSVYMPFQPHDWTTTPLLLLIWIGLWWLSATKRYLRLDAAVVTTGLLLIVSLLAGAAVAAAVMGPAEFLARW